MATDRRTTIAIIVSTLVALATNIALDLTTTLPMLGRWAIALDAAGQRSTTAAVPTTVVDTNGAGDAFFSGFFDAWRSSADVEAALVGGARQAVLALSTRQLHPALD